ncbi:hypothetical protein C8R45DRAFT_936817 [Mycena sanguinolenta]|nr:hypothetical protein C8R45DRAFT_936817 [Mycena sanguinolenta]
MKRRINENEELVSLLAIPACSYAGGTGSSVNKSVLWKTRTYIIYLVFLNGKWLQSGLDWVLKKILSIGRVEAGQSGNQWKASEKVFSGNQWNPLGLGDVTGFRWIPPKTIERRAETNQCRTMPIGRLIAPRVWFNVARTPPPCDGRFMQRNG